MRVYISRIWGEENPKPISIKFGIMIDVPDKITYTNFGDHLLRGFWVARGHIFPSAIDFHRRPYNTLALPCECVILLLGVLTFSRELRITVSKTGFLLQKPVFLFWEKSNPVFGFGFGFGSHVIGGGLQAAAALTELLLTLSRRSKRL